MLNQDDVEAIAEAVARRMPECTCGHGGHVPLLFERLKAHGDGNVEKGIESFAKSIAWVTKVRHWGEKAGGEIAMALLKWGIITLVGLAAFGFWIKYGGKGPG